MPPKYPNSGILFSNAGATGNQPNASGSLDLSEDLLRALLSRVKDGSVQIKLAAWKKQGIKGPFLSLKVDIPRDTGRERQQATYDAMGQDRKDDGDDIPF